MTESKSGSADGDSEPGPADRGEVVSLAQASNSPAERIRRLQWEARVLANEQVEALAADLEALAARALEIAEGGEAYPPGTRELASRIAEELPERAKILLTIQHRNG
jgi:hypothetical protein